MRRMVPLTIDGRLVGECDAAIFERVKVQLRSGCDVVELAKKLLADGISHAPEIIVNAQRELRNCKPAD